MIAKMIVSLETIKNTPGKIIPIETARIIFFATTRPIRIATAAMKKFKGCADKKKPAKVARPFPPRHFK